MTTPSRSTTLSRLTTRHPHLFPKDTALLHIELRLALIQERQALLRSNRDAERAGVASAPPIRSRIGESLIRLGRRVAGEGLSTPAWTG